jgi:hypothetical protein
VSQFDRRTFLLASGGLVLAACGSSGGSQARGTIRTKADGYTLAQRFPQEVIVPGTPRLPFSLASAQALLSDGPDTLYGEIRDSNGAVVISSISAHKRQVNEALCYWDFHPELASTGVYYLVIDGGTPDGGAIQINDPATVQVPIPGQKLPPFDTPTTTDPRGVDPICTRLEGGPCPFHSITLTDALASGKAVAYLIGTPAHCQFGTCAPGLEFLIDASKRVGDTMAFVHAEVYTDDSATVATPAVDAYHLQFEPSLFLADATGTIVQRLDGAWDQSELNEEIDKLLA